jgi:hypothetical protein
MVTCTGFVAQFVLGEQHVGQEAERVQYRRRAQITHTGFGDFAVAVLAGVRRQQAEHAHRG